MADDRDKPTERPADPRLRRSTVQSVFVGALLLVVITVVAVYMLGDFRGLSSGADFGLVLGITIGLALCVGVILAVLHLRRPNRH